MKLTKDFLSKLNNLKDINSNLLLKEGNTISIKNGDQQLATVVVEEKIPAKAAIYDLYSLISILNLFNMDKTSLDFNEDHILIKDDQQKAKYNLSEERFISKCVPSKNVFELLESDALGPELFSIDLSSDNLQKILGALRAMKLPHVSFEVQDSLVKVVVCNKENKGKNSIEVELAQVDCPDFKYVFNSIDFMKIPVQDYKLSLFSNVSSMVILNNDFNLFLAADVKHTVKP